MTAEVKPLGQRKTTTFDAAGQVTAMRDSNGRVSTIKHVVSQILRNGETGAAAQGLAEVLALRELEGAVTQALASGVQAGSNLRKTAYAEWELVFEAAEGVTWKLYHARPQIL